MCSFSPLQPRTCAERVACLSCDVWTVGRKGFSLMLCVVEGFGKVFTKSVEIAAWVVVLLALECPYIPSVVFPYSVALYPFRPPKRSPMSLRSVVWGWSCRPRLWAVAPAALRGYLAVALATTRSQWFLAYVSLVAPLLLLVIRCASIWRVTSFSSSDLELRSRPSWFAVAASAPSEVRFRPLVLGLLPYLLSYSLSIQGYEAVPGYVAVLYVDPCCLEPMYCFQ